jgi:hypothetical protein
MARRIRKFLPASLSGSCHFAKWEAVGTTASGCPCALRLERSACESDFKLWWFLKTARQGETRKKRGRDGKLKPFKSFHKRQRVLLHQS